MRDYRLSVEHALELTMSIHTYIIYNYIQYIFSKYFTLP